MRTSNIECEMCGETLRGKKGVHFVNREHIGFRGMFVVQLVEPEEDHYFISRNPDDEHHFCDWKCIQDFADMRRTQYEAMKRRKLQGEVRMRGGGSI